jgi:hypothetical protein
MGGSVLEVPCVSLVARLPHPSFASQNPPSPRGKVLGRKYMKKFLEKLGDLLKVKTLVTLVVIAVFAVLSLQGNIQPDNVMIIISMVVSFYFGTQHEKKT